MLEVLLVVGMLLFLGAWTYVMVQIAYDAFAPDPPPAPRPIQFRHSLLSNTHRGFVY